MIILWDFYQRQFARYQDWLDGKRYRATKVMIGAFVIFMLVSFGLIYFGKLKVLVILYLGTFLFELMFLPFVIATHRKEREDHETWR